jgi:hypothetical protein
MVDVLVVASLGRLDRRWRNNLVFLQWDCDNGALIIVASLGHLDPQQD